MMILFTNIVLTITAPTMLLGWDTGIFQEDATGDYVVGDSFAESVGATQDNKAASDIGFTDVISLVWDFLKFVLALFFGAFIILAYLEGVYAVLIGVPIVVAYGFAIMGWVK